MPNEPSATNKQYKRSLSLSEKTNRDLLELCELLGVNPHSYMVNELAKSIQRDSMTYQIKKSTEDQMAKMLSLLADLDNKG
jgi:hypothetical protein